MGTGPSIKLTTLHHYNCPLTRRMMMCKDIDFCGVVLDGVSEAYGMKLKTAAETAKMCEELGAVGAIVNIDGWGNHHIDFTTVIEELGKRDIEAIGVSFSGEQGKLVCTNEYVDVIVDYNKCVSGFETCIVGENTPDDADAVKAIAYLKRKINNRRRHKNVEASEENASIVEKSRKRWGLRRRYYDVSREDIEKAIGAVDIKGLISEYPSIKKASVDVISAADKDYYVNSNLDFEPIAVKEDGASLGEGVTRVLNNVTFMINGVDATGFQPANIGSSEGKLGEKVEMGKCGTPKKDDILIHLDVIFKDDEAKKAEAIEEAHILGERIMDVIRDAMLNGKLESMKEVREEEWEHSRRDDKNTVVLVKISSAVGNMYDTSVNPDKPAGIIGAENMRLQGNHPRYFTATEILDGAIHTLL